MELFEFTQIIKEFCDFYERAKEPRHGTIELWFDKVKKIPSEPVKWITRKIEDDHETFPKNLPSAIWAGYREWMQAYPDRIERREYSNCPDCTDGLIWARKEKDGRWYEYVFRCSRCRQCTLQAYPMAGRAELMADYDVIPKGGYPYTGPKHIPVVRRPQERTLAMEKINPIILTDLRGTV